MKALAVAASDGKVEVMRALLLTPGALSPVVLSGRIQMTDGTSGSLLHIAEGEYMVPNFLFIRLSSYLVFGIVEHYILLHSFDRYSCCSLLALVWK